jgi:transposase, IS30 family
MATSNRQVQVVQMYVKHLSREERYQIHSLLKAKQTISEIARLLGRSRSTISRELLAVVEVSVGIAPNKPAPRRLSEHSEAVMPAVQIPKSGPMWISTLGIQWSPEQIAGKVAVSHEMRLLACV